MAAVIINQLHIPQLSNKVGARHTDEEGGAEEEKEEETKQEEEMDEVVTVVDVVDGR